MKPHGMDAVSPGDTEVPMQLLLRDVEAFASRLAQQGDGKLVIEVVARNKRIIHTDFITTNRKMYGK